MEDVIKRVRDYGTNLSNNGNPHQTSVGRDILQVIDLADLAANPNRPRRVVTNDPELMKQLDKANAESATLAETVKDLEQRNVDLASKNEELKTELSAKTTQFDDAIGLIAKKDMRITELELEVEQLKATKPLSDAAAPTGGRIVAQLGKGDELGKGSVSTVGLAAAGTLGGGSESSALGTGDATKNQPTNGTISTMKPAKK